METAKTSFSAIFLGAMVMSPNRSSIWLTGWKECRWCQQCLTEKLRDFQSEVLGAAAQKRQYARNKDAGCCPFSTGGHLLLQIFSAHWEQLKKDADTMWKKNATWTRGLRLFWMKEKFTWLFEDSSIIVLQIWLLALQINLWIFHLLHVEFLHCPCGSR